MKALYVFVDERPYATSDSKPLLGIYSRTSHAYTWDYHLYQMGVLLQWSDNRQWSRKDVLGDNVNPNTAERNAAISLMVIGVVLST